LPDLRRCINSFMNEYNAHYELRVSGITSGFDYIIKQLPAMLFLFNINSAD